MRSGAPWLNPRPAPLSQYESAGGPRNSGQVAALALPRAEAHRLSWTPRSPVSLHANVRSRAVSTRVRAFGCTPAGDANVSHNPNSRVSPLKRPQDEPPRAVSLWG